MPGLALFGVQEEESELEEIELVAQEEGSGSENEEDGSGSGNEEDGSGSENEEDGPGPP